MILRITQLKRLGRFTALRCDGADGAKFLQLNVVYAPNAAGKTTLCDLFRSLDRQDPDILIGRTRLDAADAPEIILQVSGDPDPATVRFQTGTWHNADSAPQILVYDDRFVAENVLVGQHISPDQRRNLYGLVIGSQGVALQQAFNDADDALKKAGNELNIAKTALERLIPEGWNIESFRVLAPVDDIEARIAGATEELQSASQTRKQAQSIKERATLKALTIPGIPDGLEAILATTLEETALEAEGRIREHLQSHTHDLPIGWVAQGHEASIEGSCPYCGQDTEGIDLITTYTTFFSGTLKEQEEQREAARLLVETSFGELARRNLVGELETHILEQAWWRDVAAAPFDLPAYHNSNEICEAMENVYKALNAALARKTAHPGQPTELTGDELIAVEAWDAIVAALTTYNESLAPIDEHMRSKKEEADTIDLTPHKTLLAALQATKKRHQQDVIDAYAGYDPAVTKKSDASQLKQDANDALRQQSEQMLKDYGDRINELLGTFAADFRVVSEGVDFRGGASSKLAIEILGTKVPCTPAQAADATKPSLANTLSGGDRSTLALAFFIALAEREPALANSVLVLDDPYHNQDRSRRQRTINEIRRLAFTASQCFVFSHDLEFARAMVEKVFDRAPRTFVLDPIGDQPSLNARELPHLPGRAYEMKYKRLAKFCEQPNEFLDHLVEISLTLRTILEEYLQLKFPEEWRDGQDWLGNMIGAIRDAEAGHVLANAQHLVGDLTEVNDFSQRFHHRTTGATGDIPEVRELQGFAKQTISIISK